MTWSVALIEGDREFGVNDLEREDLKCLAKTSCINRSGQLATVELAHDQWQMKVQIEPNIGANERVLDVRGSFLLKKEKTPHLDWSSAVTLWSGQPQIVHRFRYGEKWHALMLHLKTAWVSENFPEEKR